MAQEKATVVGGENQFSQPMMRCEASVVSNSMGTRCWGEWNQPLRLRAVGSKMRKRYAHTCAEPFRPLVTAMEPPALRDDVLAIARRAWEDCVRSEYVGVMSSKAVVPVLVDTTLTPRSDTA